MNDLDKYTTDDLIKIFARYKGWSKAEAVEAMVVSRNNPIEARNYFLFLVREINSNEIS